MGGLDAWNGLLAAAAAAAPGAASPVVGAESGAANGFAAAGGATPSVPAGRVVTSASKFTRFELGPRKLSGVFRLLSSSSSALGKARRRPPNASASPTAPVCSEIGLVAADRLLKVSNSSRSFPLVVGPPAGDRQGSWLVDHGSP